MTKSIYLDHAATTPMRREVLEAMFPFFQQTFANPSSVHSAGLEAAVALREARMTIADILCCLPEEIIFTSGGTEADTLALMGVAESWRVHTLGSRSHKVSDGLPGQIIVSAIEHEAVMQSASELCRRGVLVKQAPVDQFGTVDPVALAELVNDETILISCMLANNEIGTVEPVGEVARAVRAVNPESVIHSDAVQAAGFCALDVDILGVDLMSLSAHKIGGPKGVGVLYARRGIRLHPIIFGGGQEMGKRSGTENVAGAVGMATALKLAQGERIAESTRLAALRDRLIAGFLNNCPGARLTGHPTNRLPGIAGFTLSGRSGESVLVDLDVRGIQCSSGSACHAGMTDPSYVLLALGLSEDDAKSGLRMSLGHETTDEDIDQVLIALSDIFEA